jgi:hypothetical protein
LLGSGPALRIRNPSPIGLRCTLAWERPGAALMPDMAKTGRSI